MLLTLFILLKLNNCEPQQDSLLFLEKIKKNLKSKRTNKTTSYVVLMMRTTKKATMPTIKHTS